MNSNEVSGSQDSNISERAKKFSTLREAILERKAGLSLFRREFLDACIEEGDVLRTRTEPKIGSYPQIIIEVFEKLVPIRESIVDWLLLESEVAPSEDFAESLVIFMERLRELKLRPNEATAWNEIWFEPHKLFAYETFLYAIAALLKTRAYKIAHELFFACYLRSESEGVSVNKQFVRYDDFYAYSEILNSALAPEGRKLYSPAAELLKRNAHRKDLPFGDLIQADLLALLVALVDPEVRWYPQTLYYSGRGVRFPFFVRATQHRYFRHLATITGVDSVGELREKVKVGYERLGVASWHNFMFDRTFAEEMNLAKLDTIN